MSNIIGLFSVVGDIIGVGDHLAVHDSEDMKHFKDTTMNEIVVMGRKTVDSLPKPLDGRIVVCLTRDTNHCSDKADVVLHDVDMVLNFIEGANRHHKNNTAYICGGAEVLGLFLPFMDSMIVTEFDVRYYIDNIKQANDSGEAVRLPSVVRDAMNTWDVKVVKKRLNTGNVVEYRRQYPELVLE